MKRTSILANKEANKGLKEVHRSRILKTLRIAKKPINYEEIARRAGMEKNQVSRRMPELISMGLACEHNTVSKTSAGRVATNYIKAA